MNLETLLDEYMELTRPKRWGSIQNALRALVQGMIALNQYRISRDETIAYDDEAFQAKANELRWIATLISKYR